MDVTLPADLTKQVEQELASGHYRSRDELIEQAVRHFFDERQVVRHRLLSQPHRRVHQRPVRHLEAEVPAEERGDVSVRYALLVLELRR